MLAMHPQVIGRPSRLWVLEQTIRHIQESGTGEFLSCAAYAETARRRLNRQRDDDGAGADDG